MRLGAEVHPLACALVNVLDDVIEREHGRSPQTPWHRMYAAMTYISITKNVSTWLHVHPHPTARTVEKNRAGGVAQLVSSGTIICAP
jgi:hypothetical protein